jgi:hypothetical protein
MTILRSHHKPNTCYILAIRVSHILIFRVEVEWYIVVGDLHRSIGSRDSSYLPEIPVAPPSVRPASLAGIVYGGQAVAHPPVQLLMPG